MKRFITGVATAGLVTILAGCADEQLAPAPSPVTEAPELSQLREKHKTADPPPPIRENRIIVEQPLVPVIQAQTTHLNDTAPVTTVSPGTVNALQRGPGGR